MRTFAQKQKVTLTANPSPLMMARPTLSDAGRNRNPLQRSVDAAAPAILQTKLQVNTGGDTYEQEAERVAEQVMRMPEPQLQRTGADSGRRNPKAEANCSAEVARPIVHEVIHSAGRPLDVSTRAFMEPRFGHDFSGVRIHTDARAAELAGAIQARAFAVGQEIVFGAGEFAPQTSHGRQLMAHELTHVVQQERSAAQSSPGTIRRQPKTESPKFPDLPNLTLKLEDDIGQNLFAYGHHFYRLATLFPDRPELLQEAFGRYALGANVLETGFRFIGLDRTAASRLAIGSGVLFKGLTFATKGEVVLDFQFDIGRGLKLETNLNLGMNPDDLTKVRKADVGIGLVGHF
ncbi:MAG TPA: DUF4157 domain-containing protein [Candidatus Udaeobacter sp.]|nr:DUF4157 domain-containing protein [Candidatus Udaeobacter sp.]